MANFSDLPNELVIEVASHAMPEDLENFCLGSKHIYAVALPLLKEHRELKSRYQDFDNLGQADFDGRRLQKPDVWADSINFNCYTGPQLSELLADVLGNPRTALYIKELRLEGWYRSWESSDNHIPYTEERFALFKEVLARYVLPEKLGTWTAEIESGDQGPIISLLLILLPHINSIKDQSYPIPIMHDLREIIERTRTDCISDIQMLSYLKRVTLQYDGYDDHETDRPTIDDLGFLATLPSLKSLYVQYLASFDNVHDFSCLQPHSSNVIELSFKQCALRLGVLGDLFQGLRALQKFHCIYPAYGEEYAMELWDPAGICELLMMYARRSLEVLDLRVNLAYEETPPFEPIESLRDFEVLCCKRVDSKLLLVSTWKTLPLTAFSFAASRFNRRNFSLCLGARPSWSNYGYRSRDGILQRSSLAYASEGLHRGAMGAWKSLRISGAAKLV